MPVYSSHFGDHRDLGVGKRIREERRRQSLTLRDIAERVHISEAKLSNIENGKVSLDLAELSRLATTLHVSVAELLPRTVVEQHLIVRGHELREAPPVLRELVGREPGPAKHHNLTWPMAEFFVGKHIEPIFVRIPPLADPDLHFISHDSEEFMFVLKGTVETQLKTNQGLVTLQLQAGDCLYFRSSLPHCHRSTISQPSETLNVIYSLRGAIDTGDGELGATGPRFYRRGVDPDASKEACDRVGLLRRTHGLTLAQLAGDIDIGVRQLAEVERGERSPDIDLLLRLARRFHRPIEYFFATSLETQPPYFVQRASELKDVPTRQRRSIWTDGPASPIIFRPLANGFAHPGMYPYYVQIMSTPSEDASPQAREHAGQEFVYVLEGELEVEIDAGNHRVTTESLQPGDSLFLESSVPHAVRGCSRNPFAATSAAFIAVFWSPIGEEYLFLRN
jgi:transcriptional regulator with XRE-family HTH domain